MGKLWDKGYELDELIERFTVGEDYRLDRSLLAADAVGSAAHAKMLASVGILSDEEADALVGECRRIARDAAAGRVEIAPQDEDGHTVIERRLTERVGEAGKRIHTGRSRNDQILAALRLYGREAIWRLLEEAGALARSLLDRAEQSASVPMVGRTHLQPAMPSSVGVWLASYAEGLVDDMLLLTTARMLTDRSPLGAAASYGTPLPIDRSMTARLLGFASVHNNVLAVNNARGKVEAVTVDAVEHVMLTLSKLATDLILFSLPELGYVQLPEELCSGSSIMPQKRNPDGLELLRSRAATVSGWSTQIKNVIRALPSGYNRDYQDAKEPFLRAVETGILALQVARRTVSSMEIDAGRLREGFRPEVFATDAALERVRGGETFRDAYRYVATHLEELGERNPDASLADRTAVGTAGNLNLESTRNEVERIEKSEERRRSEARAALRSLMGDDLRLALL